MTSSISAARIALAFTFVASAALSACGGGDSSDHQADGVHPIVVNQLFLEDGKTGKIAAFPVARPAAGTAFSDHVVAGVDGATGAMAYDAGHDQLYVAAIDKSTNLAVIRVFANASIMTNGLPDRTLTFGGGIPAFTQVTKLTLDASTDTLWVYGRNSAGLMALTSGALLPIAHASTASGAIADDAAVGVRSNGGQSYLAYDGARDVAYLTGRVDDANNPIPGVAVYASASSTFTTSGLQSPTNTIAIDGATDVAVDAAHDSLYVADPAHGLWIVRQASSASPVLVGPIARSGVASVSLDASNDRLVVGAGANAYVFDTASSLTAGSPFPAAAVVASGSGSSISSAAFH